MDADAHFSSDYRHAREAFLRGAEAVGAVLESHPIRPRGPADEELAVDVAYLGPEMPRSVLALSSGIHGVEGHAGSAVQHWLLVEGGAASRLPRDCGLLVVHALNPYGFAHHRRVNESNADLNRNFLRHPDEHVPNPDYDALCEHINPARLDEEADSEHRRALFAFAEEHGFPRLQEVLTCGQYRHPRGMQFGGVEPEASNHILRDVAARGCCGARHVAWIDLHTGLGEFGALEMITESPPDAPDYARGRAWYGAAARSTRGGESVSAPLHGTMERGLEEALGAEVELTAYAAEFGTYPALRVFQAMRADNWLQHHGELESQQGRAIKRELLEVFRPDDTRWRAQVLEGAARVIAQALDGLARA